MANKILILFSLLLFHFRNDAQVYEPMNLDTSCIWIHQYDYYSTGGVGYCNAHFVSWISGDTIISGSKYWIIRSYMGGSGSCNPNSPFHQFSAFIREDTVQRKIYKRFPNTGEELYLDFSKVIGDTIRATCDGDGNKGPITSISMDTIMGTPHSVSYANIPLIVDYRLIEGVGSNYNFPICAFNEWGIPRLKLICYRKNGVVLYSDGSFSSCDKLIPTNISEIASGKLGANFINNTLYITNQNGSQIRYRMLAPDGNVIMSGTTNNVIETIQLNNSNAGVYFIELNDHLNIKIIKVIVQ